MHAGAAGLDQSPAQLVQAGEVELGVGVEPAGRHRAVRRQHPVGPDDGAGALLADDQVVAVLVEGVDVQPGGAGLQRGAQLTGEDIVAEPLCGPDLVTVRGHQDGVAIGFVDPDWGGGDGENRHAFGVRLDPCGWLTVTGYPHGWRVNDDYRGQAWRDIQGLHCPRSSVSTPGTACCWTARRPGSNCGNCRPMWCCTVAARPASTT
ncbi:hypothetical protein GCM10027610_132510 [Dactylosporangium cerinum]